MSERKDRRVPLDLRGLRGEQPIFRLSGATRRNPDIDAWFAARPSAPGQIARQWFAQMRECGGDVLELIHDGCPVACVEDAAFGYVNAFKSHVNVGFFNGAHLDDPTGLLEGSGKQMRHVKLKVGESHVTEELTKLIDLAYADIKARLNST